MNEQILIQNKIRSHLELIQRKSPSFSLRAYAKKLSLAPSALSEILNGKRKISKKLATRILDKMNLDPQEASTILNHFDQKMLDVVRKNPRPQKSIDFLQLSSDQFNLISEWQHFAILSLMETKGFKSDPIWIAKKLSLAQPVVNQAIERLLRLGFIFKKNKKLITNKKALITSDNIPNQAVRKSHYVDLTLAEKALDACPVNERDFTAITIAANSKNLEKAKQMVRDFQDELTLCLEEGDKNEVYKFTFYLYPLTSRKPETEG
ncbi:MAG: TIGR02147 family protein [Pseudobdellovibrio sp.]